MRWCHLAYLEPGTPSANLKAWIPYAERGVIGEAAASK